MSESKHPFPRMRDLELYPLETRESLVEVGDFCEVPEPVAGFDGFVDSLPDIYAGTDFKTLVGRILRAREAGKPVVMAMGAHVLKVGLAPLIIDLARLADLSSRRGESGALEHLAGYFKSPLGDAVDHDFHRQMELLHRYANDIE